MAVDVPPLGPRAVARNAVTKHHAVQKETELAELLTLLDREIKPRTVLEVGSDQGGSLYAWRALPSVERVYAVTLPPPAGYTADYHGADAVILRNSHDPATVNLLTSMAGGTWLFDLVYIDGDHSRDGVMADLVMYGFRGRTCVLHDIVVTPQFPSCRVHEVWEFVRAMPGAARVSEIVHEPSTWGGFGIIRW